MLKIRYSQGMVRRICQEEHRVFEMKRQSEYVLTNKFFMISSGRKLAPGWPKLPQGMAQAIWPNMFAIGLKPTPKTKPLAEHPAPAMQSDRVNSKSDCMNSKGD